MDDPIKQSEQTVSKIKLLLSEMEELGQPRSNFMLAHFVVGQHDLPGRQRAQVLEELKSLMFSLADVNDDIHLAEIDIEEMQNKLEEASELEAKRLEIKIAQKQRAIQAMSLYLSGRLRECEFLLALLGKMPKYDRHQLEKEEVEYWKRRLTRQSYLTSRGDLGNFDAILQMMTNPGMPKPALPVGFEDALSAAGIQDKSLLEERPLHTNLLEGK